MTTVATSASIPVLRATESVSTETFAQIRRSMMLDHCKWDPQIGDRGTIAPFALRLSHSAWNTLKRLARKLAAETSAAEDELLHRSELWPTLAFPRRLQNVLARWPHHGLTPSAGRVMRFDFHPTRNGWKISEVNSDVPGGYTEAWNLPRLVAAHLPDNLEPAGNPGMTWARSIAAKTHAGRVALIAAPGYMEDRQLIMFMAKLLRDAGCDAEIADIRQLTWRGGHAYLHQNHADTAIDAVLRFYQAEWLTNRPRPTGWQHYFVGGKTPVTNPPAAILTESKGFPLVWDRLRTPMDTWRELLPATRSVHGTQWRNSDHWILKGKYSNNGDEVIFPDKADPGTVRRLARSLWWSPGAWVLQERFNATPLDTPAGPMNACLGVYVVEGEPVGIYGRLSSGPVVDYAAMDVAVLIDREGAKNDT